jgi:hypothetical protein
MSAAPPVEREPRHSVMLAATVERFGAAGATTHRVRNLSRRGACVGSGEELRKGETVIVGVGTLNAVGATVRWAADGLAGLAFSNPIDLTAALAKTMVRPRRQP